MQGAGQARRLHCGSRRQGQGASPGQLALMQLCSRASGTMRAWGAPAMGSADTKHRKSCRHAQGEGGTAAGRASEWPVCCHATRTCCFPPACPSPLARAHSPRSRPPCAPAPPPPPAFAPAWAPSPASSASCPGRPSRPAEREAGGAEDTRLMHCSSPCSSSLWQRQHMAAPLAAANEPLAIHPCRLASAMYLSSTRSAGPSCPWPREMSVSFSFSTVRPTAAGRRFGRQVLKRSQRERRPAARNGAAATLCLTAAGVRLDLGGWRVAGEEDEEDGGGRGGLRQQSLGGEGLRADVPAGGAKEGGDGAGGGSVARQDGSLAWRH